MANWLLAETSGNPLVVGSHTGKKIKMIGGKFYGKICKRVRKRYYVSGKIC